MRVRFRFYFYSRYRNFNKIIKPRHLFTLLLSYLAWALILITDVTFNPATRSNLRIKLLLRKKNQVSHTVLKSPLAQRQWAQEQYSASFFILTINLITSKHKQLSPAPTTDGVITSTAFIYNPLIHFFLMNYSFMATDLMVTLRTLSLVRF